jgi:hypothetical protein
MYLLPNIFIGYSVCLIFDLQWTAGSEKIKVSVNYIYRAIVYFSDCICIVYLNFHLSSKQLTVTIDSILRQDLDPRGSCMATLITKFFLSILDANEHDFVCSIHLSRIPKYIYLPLMANIKNDTNAHNPLAVTIQ